MLLIKTSLCFTQSWIAGKIEFNHIHFLKPFLGKYVYSNGSIVYLRGRLNLLFQIKIKFAGKVMLIHTLPVQILFFKFGYFIKIFLILRWSFRTWSSMNIKIKYIFVTGRSSQATYMVTVIDNLNILRALVYGATIVLFVCIWSFVCKLECDYCCIHHCCK